ncbi:MAG: hypothetical protein PHD54_00895 [Desulfuromonadaceae bacterium]|nr:hypothetical protein [Desulfuromonadaceae bacterium]
MARLFCLLTAGYICTVISSPSAFAAGNGKNINERILVIHSIPIQKEIDPELIPRINAYDGIVEYLTDQGFRIVDKASAEHCSIQVAATHDIDPVINKAASFGLKYFAEYTVYFKTSSIFKDLEESKGALVRITAKVVDNTSSQVVASKVAESSSGGLTLNDATEKAGRAAGKKMAALLATAMGKFFHDSGNTGRIYTIILESSDSARDLLLILSKLENNRSVAAARERESGGGKATFEIIYKGNRDQLDRDIIKSAGELGWELTRVRSEGNRSTWKIK